MVLMSAFRPVLLLTVLLLPRVLLAEVTVTRSDPVIERITFDPKNPPSDMPKLHPNEAAIARAAFSANTRVGGLVVERKPGESGFRATLRIDTVRINLDLHVTIWLPRNAVPKIVNHEEGHRKIAEYYYQNAEQIARQEAGKLIGQTVTGTGADYASAEDNALKDAREALNKRLLDLADAPSGKAQEYYDQITAHGTNAVKEDRAVEQAIRKAPATSRNDQ
jgi:hypothetical protein